MAMKKVFKINGLVVDSESRRGVEGLRVEAWDKDRIVDDMVGSAVTDVDGRFQIEFTRSYFGELFFDREPDLYFKVFAGGELISSTEDSVLWNVSAGDVPVEIAVKVPVDVTPAGGGGGAGVGGDDYTLSGTVASPERGGVGGLRVRVLDKNVGRDVLLAETQTDARGAYGVTVAAAKVRALGKERPDFQTVVYANDSVLAASEVLYDAGTRETLNVTLPSNSAALPSEYETLKGALAIHYKGSLGELQETDERQDITYLANKSGWDARAVALAALAEQFSARSSESNAQNEDGEGGRGIEPAYFYALFRAGLPASEQTLYHTDAATLAAVWNRAAEQGLIPRASADDVTEVVGRFQALGARSLLSGATVVGASSMKEMLSVSRLDDAQQQRFAELYTAHRADMASFWDAAAEALGAEAARRLQVDGKLAFLTVNNAPLVSALHAAAEGELSDPLQLAQAGFHRAARWESLLTEEVPIPKEVPGDTPEAKRENYAQYLAAQVRLSYPTAAVAEMVGSGGLGVGAREQVREFLTEHQDRFELGAQPIEQYVRRQGIEVAPETLTQIKRLQRVYQITPDDGAMAGLLKHEVDSAYKVVRYDKEAFVRKFAEDLGGADAAAAVHERSVQVHNAVLNIAVSYITARNGVALGSAPAQAARPGQDTSALMRQPAPKHSGQTNNSAQSVSQGIARPAADGLSTSGTPGAAPNAEDVLAYETLETLFGEMDFCECDHCRSVLSPAAYLVDLLQFLDNPDLNPNPQNVLLDRRPDIEHLPLTCENTNTALPYIDVVNETLEYFVANGVQTLSLEGYTGHDTGGTASADLLASPQFVIDSAYTVLRNESFPAPLPFHRPLESLRRHFDKFGVPLPLALERLRVSDALERGAQTYGWRDILAEELSVSRAEYEILTDSAAVPLLKLYGFPITEPDAVGSLSNAKSFARRVGITYEEIVSILRTRFINPDAYLLPKLERLGVSVATLAKLKTNNNAATDAEFDALLPTGALAPNPAEYGGNIKTWVKSPPNYARIMGLITLTSTADDPDPCNFDTLEFRHTRPAADDSNRLDEVEFVRLLRFVRLWKKTGWTIEQTDAAVCALYRVDAAPLDASDVDTPAKLDAGFLTLLPRLGVLVRVMRALSLSPKRDLLPLLACFSDIGTYGEGALYRQMFLNPALLKQDAVYADNGYGEFLAGGTASLTAHSESLRSAFNLTGDEFARIVAALGYNHTTPLTVPHVSEIFRRGWLARKLSLSVRELLMLIELTGLDPFAPPNPTAPALLELISLVQELKARSLPLSAALYLVWNRDLGGKSVPTDAQVNDFARTLRTGLSKIESEFAVASDPTGEVARSRMTLVYGAEAADFYFSLLDETFTTEARYSHFDPSFGAALAAAVKATAGAYGDTTGSRLAYDDFRQRLTFNGVLDEDRRDDLKAVALDAAVVAEILALPLPRNPPVVLTKFQTDFATAIDALYLANQKVVGPFFARYAELLPLYAAFVQSSDPPKTKRDTLLASFLPDLISRRKIQQTLQSIAEAAQTDRAFAETLLNPTPPGSGLHSVVNAGDPALEDLLALETRGLSVQFYDGSSVHVGTPHTPAIAAGLTYAPVTPNKLPQNMTVPTDPVSGIWSGYVEAPENGLYVFAVEANLNSTVSLKVEGQELDLTQSGVVWRPADPLPLKAGTLYRFELFVSAVTDKLRVQWERDGSGRTAIPPSALYPETLLRAARVTYIRFLKAASLAKALGLSAAETARHMPPAPSWLDALPVEGDAPKPAALLPHLRALLDYARLKAEISPGDESLLALMRDPVAAAAQADGPLYTLTRWDAGSLHALLTHFGTKAAGLSDLELFRRVHDAFALTRQMGIPADALIAAATNEPTALILRDLQSALRARYDAESWREVVKPVNDQVRALQRDALVAHILHRLRSDAATAHIDTPDKLFEYFLMDVQMEPCMLTSRIRHALSSVQLFVERCTLGLEPQVAPASLNMKQWQWMKRYRVWEANRKVFLWPENWLEPELRDDKSPLFKEIESELLQSDITEESAASALLNYLSKLEEIAKLEPCGIHHVDADPARRIGEVDHVIARSAGGHRRHYSSRRENGQWTPWEHVKLDIEDNPVAPVVWRDRLLLFWLRVMQQGVVDKAAQGPSSKPNSSAPNPTTAELAADAKDSAKTKMTVQAVLCWSEYYNGKWQPARTSEVERPTELGKFFPAGPGAFQRSALQLRFDEEGDALRVSVYGNGNATFLLYNTHSLPAHDTPAAGGKLSLDNTQLVAYTVGKWRNFTGAVGDFTVTYGKGALLFGGGLTRKVLKPQLPPRLVEPHHRLADVWGAPFFLEDWRHVFFVKTSEEPVLVKRSLDYGVAVNPGGVNDTALTPQFTPGAAGGVRFDGKLIGPDGSFDDAQTAPE
jgi:hypothetical protein